MVKRFQKAQNAKEGDPDYFFYCPGCGCDHGVWTESKNSRNAVWQFNGDIENPTVSPSLLIQYEGWEPPVTHENYEQWKQNPWKQEKVQKVCHSFIRNGYIEYLNDCTHNLKGQTILLPEI